MAWLRALGVLGRRGIQDPGLLGQVFWDPGQQGQVNFDPERPDLIAVLQGGEKFVAAERDERVELLLQLLGNVAGGPGVDGAYGGPGAAATADGARSLLQPLVTRRGGGGGHGLRFGQRVLLLLGLQVRVRGGGGRGGFCVYELLGFGDDPAQPPRAALLAGHRGAQLLAVARSAVAAGPGLGGLRGAHHARPQRVGSRGLLGPVAVGGVAGGGPVGAPGGLLARGPPGGRRCALGGGRTGHGGRLGGCAHGHGHGGGRRLLLHSLAPRGLVRSPWPLLLLAGALDVLVSQAGLANVGQLRTVLHFLFRRSVVLIALWPVALILDQNRRLVGINFV